MLSIEDLIKRIQKSEKTRTNEERRALLIKAKVLDENGHYHPDFFTAETVAKSKLQKAS